MIDVKSLIYSVLYRPTLKIFLNFLISVLLMLKNISVIKDIFIKFGNYGNDASKGEVSPMIKVKLFDYEHEKDLEKDMNHFLKDMDDKKLIDIKYNVAALPEDEEAQIYCFTAMVIYRS